jgi:hypothetical protein
MIIKTSRMIAMALAVTVLFAYSVPVHAAFTAPVRSLLPVSPTVQTDDDDDDGMSGGALAVLLLAIGGAVAAVLYVRSNPGLGGRTSPAIEFKRAGSSDSRVKMRETDSSGRSAVTDWAASMDPTSRTVKLTSAGPRTHTEWKGKVDGRFYPVTGDPKADEMSFTNTDSRTIVVTAKKAGRVTVIAQVAASVNGRSFAMSENGTSYKGRRVNTRATYDVR